MDDPLFLSEEQILAIHAEQLRLFGGARGLADHNLLSSAVIQPQNTFFYGGPCSLFDLAAVYAFHISKNHAFRDGNKRTGVASAIAFLDVNGWQVQKDLTEAMMDLVTNKITKENFSLILKKASQKSLIQRIVDFRKFVGGG